MKTAVQLTHAPVTRRRIARSCIAALLLVPTSLLVAQSPSEVVITDVTLIDGTGAAARPRMTVLVRAGRIAAVGDAAKVAVPAGALRIAGRGKFLIPGLCDAHAHLYHGTQALSLFVAHGVTSVHEMWGDVGQLREWRARIRSGALLGPDILMIAGPWPDSQVTAAEAGPLMDSLVSQGADFIKVGSQDTTSYRALAAEARQRGVRLLGHLPPSLRVRDAIALGQSRIEHTDPMLLIASSEREADLLPRWRAAVHAEDRATGATILMEAIQSSSPGKRAALVRQLVTNGVALTPTLVNHRASAAAGDSNFAADPRLRFFPDTARRAWADYAAKQRRSPQDKQLANRILRGQLEFVGAMHRAGVPILAGSDAGDRYRYYGSSLHDELALLTEAGLSPMAALLAATRNPAADLDLLGERGTIAVGKVADLVLLDADPLADIRNVRRVHTVLLRGRPLLPAELRRITEEAAQRTASAR